MSAIRSFLVTLLSSATLLAGDPHSYPEPLPGGLVLTGNPEPDKLARQALIELAGGKEKAKIVIVHDKAAKKDHLRDLFAELKDDQLAFISPGESPDEGENPFRDATGVWLALSKANHADNLTGFDEGLRSLFGKGAVIGAGGEIAALVGQWRLDTEKPETLLGGLNLVPNLLVVRANTDEASRPTAKAVRIRPGSIGLTLYPHSTIAAKERRWLVLRGSNGDNGTPNDNDKPADAESFVTLEMGPTAGKPAVAQRVPGGRAIDWFQVSKAAANRASPMPFPPKNPKPPELSNGSLLIVGGGGAGPEIWKKFIELAGGPDARFVVVPTASEERVPIFPGEIAILKKFGVKNVEVLHTRDRKRANEPEFSEVLEKADAVWFGGGRQWRFVDAYEGTLTEKRFHEVLQRGGVIGGSSAGASIQSEYMPRGHPLGNTLMMAEGYEKGFGFLPGAAVDQHFFARKRTKDMTDLMNAYPQYLGIGIDEGTAIVVQKSTAEVIGKSKVGFYDYRNGRPEGDNDFTEVKAGEKYDLIKRKKVEE